MSMTDQEWIKAQLVRAITKMEPQHVSLVYWFIQGLTGNWCLANEKETEEVMLLGRITDILYLINNLPLVKRIYKYVEYLYLHND